MDKKVRYVSPLKSINYHIDRCATSMFKANDRDNSRCSLGSLGSAKKASTYQGHAVWKSIHYANFYIFEC